MDKVQNGQLKDAQSGFGAVLRAAREEQGISLGDMETRSRLSIAQLKALEEENMAHLPEPVYVRAFIRNVARVLRIDPTPLLNDYTARYAQTTDPVGVLPQTDVAHEPVISHSSGHRGLRLVAGLVLLCVLVAAVWYAFTDQGGVRTQVVEMITGKSSTEATGGKTENTEAAKIAEASGLKQPAAQQSTTPMVAPAPAPLTPAQAPESAPAAGAAQSPAQPAATNAAAQSPAAAAAAAPAAQTQANRPAETKPEAAEPAKTEKPAARAGERQVVLRVSADCWVEVLSRNNDKIFSRTMSADSSATIVVPAGARFTFGNAPAVSMTVDGSKYSISSYTQKGVARFELK